MAGKRCNGVSTYYQGNLRLSKAYCEGRKASADGLLITANPEDGLGTELETVWDQGWNDEDGGVVDKGCCAE